MIGIQYVVTTIIFFCIGGLLAMLFRAELAQPGDQYFNPQTFNVLISEHAALMIFLFVIPAFAGLGNYVIPLMLGAADMAFPRLNALSFWLLPIAGVMLVAGMATPGGGPSAGWTAYAPLSVHQPLGQIFFNMGVQWAGASSIMTALNFLVTIITMRAPGMTFWRMPLLVWANFTTSLLVVIATPFIAGSQFFVMFDRVMHTNFFEVSGGGYVLGYQHIFWFYSHPAVYIMILPGFGIISEIIAVMSRKPIFGYRLMALSLMAILVLGFSVWAHHMFVAGMAGWLRVPMMVTSMVIAVPTGVKVFSWLATMWNGRLHFTTPMLFATGFISMFVLGGLSGIYLASVPIDIHASDTYFIVAHIHYVLFGGSVFTIFAGIYYWFPKMTGRMYDERLGKLHFWLTFIGFNLTFFPMHYIGLQGMPRRVADYADRFADINLFISIASFGLGASTLVFLYNMARSWAHGPIAPGNPWRALTLEWQVSSPPPTFNFDEIPQVVGNPYEYGTPGARHAIFGAAPARAGRVDPDRCRLMSHILVIANETAASSTLLDAVRSTAGSDDLVTVIAPVNEPNQGYVVYEDTRRASAGRRLDRTLTVLRESGVPTQGFVVETGPVQAVKDALAQLEPRVDEIVVSTHSVERSGWMRRDVVQEIERTAQGHPGQARDRRARPRREHQRPRRREPDRALGRAARSHPEAGRAGEGRVPDRGAASRHGRARRRGPQTAPRSHRAAQRRDQRTWADRPPRPAHGGAERRPRRAGRRDHRLHVPGREERLVAARPRRASAQGHRTAGRPRDLARPPGGQFLSAAAEAHEHHGPPPIHYSSRVSPALLGMLLFIASEIMLFGSFFTVYFFDRVVNNGVNGVWPPAPFHRPVFVAGLNTLILVSSSASMHWADTSVKRGNRAGLKAGLVLTLCLGTSFLLTQFIEYQPPRLQHERHLVRRDVLRPDRPARCACLRRPDDPARDDDPGVPRAFLARASPRDRAGRDLLAFRRRDVDRRVRDRLSSLAPDA